MGQHPAVFLDRDGTLNVEKDYLYRIEDWEWLPGVKEALRGLKQAGFLLVVITNQSGIGRGWYTEAAARELHGFVRQELLAEGVAMDGFYLCPHAPDAPAGACGCRKPSPALLLRAAADFDIDLSRSWMVGDKVADVMAGRNAGCASILVRTGHGAREERAAEAGTLVADDLAAAARLILGSVPVCRDTSSGIVFCSGRVP